MHFENKQLSERENDVVKLLLQGKSNKQIALELGIANRTVEFHLSNVYVKLGVKSRAEVILRFAEEHLRESSGVLQVKSTVADIGNSTENGLKSILRRSPVKNLYILIGVLLTTVFIATVIILNQPIYSQASSSTIPSEQTPATNATITQLPLDAAPTSSEINPLANIVIPPHTVNGITATIESYYVDTSHIIFQVRLTGGEAAFGDEYFYGQIESPDLYDEYGSLINASGGWGPAIDPALHHFEFVPVTLFKGDRIKGQFAFDVTNAPEYEKTLAQFRFDFDLPIYPDVRFHPKQVVTANGVEMFLDSVTITPTFTQVYLCFPRPSFADWLIGSESLLQMDEQTAKPYNSRVLFDSELGGDRRAGSEPDWVPPTKNGRCIKSGFPIGSSDPTTLTLTIPQLDKTVPDLFLTNQLATDYPGLSPKEAYYTYLQEHGDTYKGPWIFTVKLAP